MRWVGSKRHMVDRVLPLIHAHRARSKGRLISLFFGSGAIERVAGSCAIGAEFSPELLQLFADLQTAGPEAVHAALLKYAGERQFSIEAYRRAREVDADARAPLTSSARFLYLCSFAFNGLWRVNSAGVMNVAPDPGRLAKRFATLPPLEAFTAFAHQIAGIRFVRGWQTALALSRPGDILLVDSPYGKFDGYCAGGFSPKDHRLLASALKDAMRTGIGFIGFNAPTAATIYHWAECETVTRSGCVSSDGDGREPVEELIITAGLRR